MPGKEQPDYGRSCNNLANFYLEIGKYEKAEPLFVEAKRIFEKVPGENYADYALSCSNLANLYSKMGQYEKAESLFLEAKNIIENAPGKEHLNMHQFVMILQIYILKMVNIKGLNFFSLKRKI